MHSTSALRSRLRAVSHLQSVISQAASPSLTFQTQALAQLNVAFEHLLHVHRMPTAWGAVIVEIVRRREFWRVVFERGEVFADAVAKFIESEKRRRQSFDTEIGRYLPRDGKDGKPVVWGLDVGVPRLEVKVVGGRGGPNDEFLPEIEKKDIYEFEQLISQIRTAMIDVDPMASAVRSANQTIASSPTSSIASPSNSISKLQATITKMLPQVDSLVPEFEKYVLKSGVCGDRFLKLEEEILRLKAEAGTHKSVSNSVTSKNASTTATAIGSPSVRRILASKSMGNFDATNTRVQETLKSYENRIRELEDLLQTSYYDSRLAKSTSVNGTSSDPTVQILQTENNTLKTRLAFLESQFTTTSDDLLAKETKLKELRGLFESDRKRIAEQDKEINELRSLVNEKDREGRMVVSEVERCAGFIREVSELVDECAEAFKVGGQETLDPMPLERHPPEQPSSADSNEGNMSTLRAVKIRSSTSSKYQSPTSPSTGLMALVNATQSFGTSNSPNTIRTASGFVNPMQHATPFTLLSNLRSDEQKIRKKLRELQDDIRCQTLELVGLQNDLANLGPRTESPHDGNTENGSEAVLQDGSVLEVGVFGSPSRSGMSDPSAPEISRNRFFEELQSSKREIKRLNDVIEELNNAFMAVKAEASGFLVKAEAERHELLEKDKKVTELNETIAKLMMEKSDATELYDEMVMKVERLKTVLSTVQAEKDTVESQLGEAMKNYDRLERAWSSRMQESTSNFEGEIRTLKAEISESKTFHSEKIRLLEAANGELRSKIVDLLESARKMEESLQNLKFDLITRTTEVGQKSIEIGRLEQLCGKFRVSVGRQKGHILRLKEKNKDWSIVCKMAVESLAARLDSLQKVGETLARFDEMFHGQYTPVDENSAAEFGFKNILQVSHVDVQSFKSAANDMSSRNPNSDENECGSENSELGSLSEDMRDLYHEIITAVDSVDVCSWAESVVQATNAWTEFLAQQRMKLSVSERGKIAFSSFREGDLALFLPTRHPKAWAAFNVNAPHYFLSTTSALESFPVQIKKRDWILGHISKIEHRKAVNAEGESGRGEGNPFGLVAGTSFHWCDVTPLQEPSQPQANASR
ncbi:oligomeric, coiled-coil, peripheral membrane protein [Entophlyctis luteolus]|nr:oligomeric, coiled-coil, peripheral membrane protein [Entophlyctis luteolus]